jgi:hypothetical protein
MTFNENTTTSFSFTVVCNTAGVSYPLIFNDVLYNVNITTIAVSVHERIFIFLFHLNHNFTIKSRTKEIPMISRELPLIL